MLHSAALSIWCLYVVRNILQMFIWNFFSVHLISMGWLTVSTCIYHMLLYCLQVSTCTITSYHSNWLLCLVTECFLNRFMCFCVSKTLLLLFPFKAFFFFSVLDLTDINKAAGKQKRVCSDTRNITRFFSLLT